MTRAALFAAALCWGACARQEPASELPAGLRVPRPSGWRVTAVGDGLLIGPAGRTVVQLEHSTRPLPDAKAFLAAIEADGAQVLHKESNETFVGVSYSIKERPAFLGVRLVGPSTIWCSSAPGAKADEVEEARTVCRGLSFESDAAK